MSNSQPTPTPQHWHQQCSVLTKWKWSEVLWGSFEHGNGIESESTGSAPTYLEDIFQYCELGGKRSKITRILQGVFQGSILVPLLYICTPHILHWRMKYESSIFMLMTPMQGLHWQETYLHGCTSLKVQQQNPDSKSSIQILMKKKELKKNHGELSLIMKG